MKNILSPKIVGYCSRESENASIETMIGSRRKIFGKVVFWPEFFFESGILVILGKNRVDWYRNGPKPTDLKFSCKI